MNSAIAHTPGVPGGKLIIQDDNIFTRTITSKQPEFRHGISHGLPRLPAK